MNFFLIGFMGSGKTYWGKIWAHQMGLDFYDLDEIIEQSEKKSIAAIFEKEGEEYFRKIETLALHQFSKIENAVIACGGASGIDDLYHAAVNGASAVAAGSMFVFQRPHRAVLISYPSQQELKEKVFQRI